MQGSAAQPQLRWVISRARPQSCGLMKPHLSDWRLSTFGTVERSFQVMLKVTTIQKQLHLITGQDLDLDYVVGEKCVPNLTEVTFLGA